MTYPEAPRGTQIDDYHGTKVNDPYRSLEDIDSPATQAWVAAEGRLSRRYLDAIAGRESMTKRLRDIWNYERWTPTGASLPTRCPMPARTGRSGACAT